VSKEVFVVTIGGTRGCGPSLRDSPPKLGSNIRCRGDGHHDGGIEANLYTGGCLSRRGLPEIVPLQLFMDGLRNIGVGCRIERENQIWKRNMILATSKLNIPSSLQWLVPD
jgi:hypothetical protein